MTAPFHQQNIPLQRLLSPLLQSDDELPLVNGSTKHQTSAEWVNDLMDTMLRGYVGDQAAVQTLAQSLEEDITVSARRTYCASGKTPSFRQSGHLMAPLVGAACDCLIDSSTCARVLPSTDFPASARSKANSVNNRIEPMKVCSNDEKLGLYLWAGFATGIAIVLLISLIIVCTKRKK